MNTHNLLLSALSLFVILLSVFTSTVHAQSLQGQGDLVAPVPIHESIVSNINPDTPVSSDDITAVACTMDAKICPDGSAVGRVAPNCEFAPCPETPPVPPVVDNVFCTMDAKECSDGSFVGRVPPSCNFAPCPDEVVVPQPGEPVACTEEAKVCPDGSAVSRVPPSCEFAPCPVVKPPQTPSAIDDAGSTPSSEGLGLEEMILQGTFNEDDEKIFHELTEETKKYFNDDKDTRAYARLVKSNDHRISEILVTETGVEVAYNTNGKFFGLFAKEFSSKVVVGNDGAVTVTVPWYTFLMSGTTHADLKAQVSQEISDVPRYTDTSSEASFSKAKILQAVAKSIKLVVDDSVFLSPTPL